MKDPVLQLPPPHERPKTTARSLSSDRTVARLDDYRMVHLDGCRLVHGTKSRWLSPRMAYTIAEVIHWCRASATATKPSSRRVFRIPVVAVGRQVTLEGWGPPLRGKQVDDLLEQLLRVAKGCEHA